MSLVVLSARELFCVTTAKVKTVTKKKSLAQKHTANEYSHATSIVRLKRCNLRLSTALSPTQILAVLHYN